MDIIVIYFCLFVYFLFHFIKCFNKKYKREKQIDLATENLIINKDSEIGEKKTDANKQDTEGETKKKLTIRERIQKIPR